MQKGSEKAETYGIGNLPVNENALLITSTGRRIDLFNGPKPEEVDIEDIAHSLAFQCRYVGHAKQFYSVADHSIHMTKFIDDPERALYYLLHDAHETYYQDISAPMKKVFGRFGFLRHYKELCDKADKAIMAALGLSYEKFHNLHDRIKETDNYLYTIERKILFNNVSTTDLGNSHPLYASAFGHPPDVAKNMFLKIFMDLKGSL